MVEPEFNTLREAIMGVRGEDSAIGNRRKRRIFRHFIKNRDGVTAIEFALLAMPFFLLVCAIIETCIAFAAQELISNATDDVARQFRTGRITAASNLSETTLRKMVCDRISIMVSDDCPGLTVDLRQFATFEEAANTASSSSLSALQPKVDLGPALTKNMLRVYYRWPIITNRLGQNLPDGKMLLFSAATWQNEPF